MDQINVEICVYTLPHFFINLAVETPLRKNNAHTLGSLHFVKYDR
ncbi:hypothetical protein ARTHRO9AX_220038 [Arthrobacter sp. 9AX]|nr:hypothetical protein ARTHRO9AX_220038 [Arthrobacter sp. 9AX]